MKVIPPPNFQFKINQAVLCMCPGILIGNQLGHQFGHQFGHKIGDILAE
jgi:hypothetical protein